LGTGGTITLFPPGKWKILLAWLCFSKKNTVYQGLQAFFAMRDTVKNCDTLCDKNNTSSNTFSVDFQKPGTVDAGNKSWN
jgi:hypothetical protein